MELPKTRERPVGVMVEVISGMVDEVRSDLDILTSKEPGVHPDDGHTVLIYHPLDEKLFIEVAQTHPGVTKATSDAT
jgi:hypothetical protein